MTHSEVAYSVVIPTANHPELLARCLESLRQVKEPSLGWEALAIDNSAEAYKADNSQVVSSFREPRFRYIPMDPLGLMAARHFGIERARGRIVSLIDDDAFVAQSWLEGIERSFRDPNVMLMGGPNRPLYETSPPDWLGYLWKETAHGRSLGYLSLLEFGAEECDIPTHFVWGCNYSIRKELFYRVRGSHPDYLPGQWKQYQGDGEMALSTKVSALGYEARYCPDCAISHFVPASRMTLDYLKARAYFVGLHSSFTELRREHGLGASHGVPPDPTAQRGTLYRLARTWLGPIKRAVFRPKSVTTVEPEEVTRIRQLLRASYWDGWHYHRGQVQESPDLLAYVLRPDYMGENARLP